MKDFFDIAGHISTGLVILSAVAAGFLWSRGLIPVLIRLGNGLSRRKIAIFAQGDSLTSLENLLNDSKLFNRANIVRIPTEEDFGRAQGVSLFLVYWPDWADALPKILSRKADGAALIVYAPQEHGYIPKEAMDLLGKHRNVVVNNFRGRLLNDIVVSMITASYEKG